MKRLSGAWFKLVDSSCEPIGLLMVPEHMADVLERGRPAHAYSGQDMSRWYPYGFNDLAPVFLRQFTIVPEYQPTCGDCVYVHGISPEELANKEGFAFVPNAAYLRRPVAEPEPKAPEPIASGPYLVAAREIQGT